MRLALVAVVVSGACGSEGDDEPTCAERITAEVAYEHIDGNGTYANTACVVAGCHLEGSPGPAFHAAGTRTPASGSTSDGCR